jgi:hypothetical protein
MVETLSMFINKNYEKELTATQSYLGFPILSSPNFLRESVTLVKEYCHVGILESDKHLDFDL